MKAEWRCGKVDSVKLGRDKKIREVNIAYKILKEDSDDPLVWFQEEVILFTQIIVR